MLPTEDLFVYIYAIVDDAIKAAAIAIPGRPGPAPGCSDAEILAITQVRPRFGRDAAHAGWFYGFRLAVRTDLGSRIVRAWSIVPATVNERDVATGLLQARPPPRDLLGDKGFTAKAFAASQAARGTAVLVPPTKDQRKTMPVILQKVIAQCRVETTFKEITDQMELARHGAHLLGACSPGQPRPSPLIP